MKNFLKVVVFSLIVLSFYTIYPMTLPQQRSEPPPLEEKMGALSMEELIAIGADIFSDARGGFGGCILCHDPKLGRAPELVNMHVTSVERLKDPRYKGKATNGEEYLRESIMEPSAFVVAGYGKPGTNDTVSPMLQITKYLKPWEINAAIAYLQSKDGGEVTVSPPTGEEGGAEEASEAPAAPAKTPKELVEKYECGVCHKHLALGLDSEDAPELTHVGSVAGKRKPGYSAKDYIRESILTPKAFVVQGFKPIMPTGFGDQMTAGEFEMIVKYLSESK